MKASEIRELSLDEMQGRIGEMKEELFNLRFQHETGQLESPHKLRTIRRDIARLNTLIREFELKEN